MPDFGQRKRRHRRLSLCLQWRPRSESNRRTRLCRPLAHDIYQIVTAFATRFATRSVPASVRSRHSGEIDARICVNLDSALRIAPAPPWRMWLPQQRRAAQHLTQRKIPRTRKTKSRRAASTASAADWQSLSMRPRLVQWRPLARPTRSHRRRIALQAQRNLRQHSRQADPSNDVSTPPKR